MLSGIAQIDALHSNPGAAPITSAETDKLVVGAVQDLLTAHGAKSLPGPLNSSRGLFGPATRGAVTDFQTANGLPATGAIDQGTLNALITLPAVSPTTSQPYVTMVLDLEWTGMTRLVALTAQFEASGRFTACNRNTDRAGLSYGIIQWAQKPGRLLDIVRAFQKAQPERFVQVFGAGDATVADGLVAFLRKPNGGAADDGKTTDPNFDLPGDVWTGRFIDAGRDTAWQKTQLTVAMSAFQESLNAIRAAAPAAKSERAIAFLLDVANQHGDGGMRAICTKVMTPGMSEPDFLQAVQNESVSRLAAKFGEHSSERDSTFSRRESFRTTPLLSDEAFQG